MNMVFRCTWLLVLPLLATLYGCGFSAPAHFYALSSGHPQQEDVRKDGPCFSLGVGPVRIPAYLDRSAFVTQTGANRLQVADFDQWGEPLADGLTRVLTANLSDLLCIRPIATIPLPEGIRTDYQVTVQVVRFDGSLGGQVFLLATWSILDSEGLLVSWNSSKFQEPVKGEHFDSLAAAMSSLAMDLSREIAAELNKIVREGKTNQ